MENNNGTMITNIKLDKLIPHPDNPRKNLGDITELSDSIRESGVLQNLTVVPVDPDKYNKNIASKHAYTGDYTIIIGHRRHAAAKLAGFEEIPCAVTDMDYKTQIATMLLENMQRRDLEFHEEADGFQLMLDLGDTVADVATKTGVSSTTIRRRLNLLPLDRGKLVEAEARGATLADLAELEKVKDIETRNKLLATAGTHNFKNNIQQAIASEKKAVYLDECAAALALFATEIETVDYKAMCYVTNYGWDKKQVERPNDADSVKYYYRRSAYQIDLYRQIVDENTAENIETDEDREKRLTKERHARRIAELKEATRRSHKLRADFVRNFGGAKQHTAKILKAAAYTLICHNEWGAEFDGELFATLLGVEPDTDFEPCLIFENEAIDRLEYTALVTVMAAIDGDKVGYYDIEWDYAAQAVVAEYVENEALDFLYDFLCDLGYQMSDEEKALRDGTHELFEDEREAEENNVE